MSEQWAGYGIVVSVDGSPESDSATRWAAREAEMRRLPITLIHVVNPVAVSWPANIYQTGFFQWQEDFARHVIIQAQRILLVEFDASQRPTVHTDVLHGHAVAELTRVSGQAHLIVVGSRGLTAIAGAAFGSVSNGLLHHAQCPVAVIHTEVPPAAGLALPVLLGIDGSPASEAATATAFDEASRRGVDLVALHAWSDVGVLPALGMDWREYEDEGHEILAERLAGWHELYPDVHVDRRIVCDQPARWLIEESQRAQLVVVGSHGRGGFKGMLLGSVSAAVARHAKSPVLVVRGGAERLTAPSQVLSESVAASSNT